MPLLIISSMGIVMTPFPTVAILAFSLWHGLRPSPRPPTAGLLRRSDRQFPNRETFGRVGETVGD
ncbi:MAG: hypothetical protein ACREJM_00770, partial [Candidatus Saccharimonadales bacterium]